MRHTIHDWLMALKRARSAYKKGSAGRRFFAWWRMDLWERLD